MAFGAIFAGVLFGLGCVLAVGGVLEDERWALWASAVCFAAAVVLCVVLDDSPAYRRRPSVTIIGGRLFVM